MQWVDRIPAFSDNYIWALRHENASTAVVVDPGQSAPVLAYLKTHNLSLSAILITHHHADHVGGISDLKQEFSCKVYGPAKESIHGIDQALVEGEQIHLPDINKSFAILDLPGHTLGHIAYYSDPWLFCGDTLFAGGCGRLFEGTPKQMLNSLEKLTHLPTHTEIYCAHEYTKANLTFANAAEPGSKALAIRTEQVYTLRRDNQATVPSTIGAELETNPFLRCHIPTLKKAAETFSGKTLSTTVDVFAEIRKWKDGF